MKKEIKSARERTSNGQFACKYSSKMIKVSVRLPSETVKKLREMNDYSEFLRALIVEAVQ